MHTHFLISLTRLVFDLLGHILLHSVFPYERRGGEERGGRWLIEDLKFLPGVFPQCIAGHWRKQTKH